VTSPSCSTSWQLMRAVYTASTQKRNDSIKWHHMISPKKNARTVPWPAKLWDERCILLDCLPWMLLSTFIRSKIATWTLWEASDKRLSLFNTRYVRHGLGSGPAPVVHSEQLASSDSHLLGWGASTTQSRKPCVAGCEVLECIYTAAEAKVRGAPTEVHCGDFVHVVGHVQLLLAASVLFQCTINLLMTCGTTYVCISM
jgi:hypothetical protein